MKSSHRPALRGFTLIEMLAVITIIVILAALTVGGMGMVKDKQAMKKAEVQVKMLANALEDYKLDNGIYPPSTEPSGRRQTNDLFRALYWNGARDTATPQDKVYLSELDPENNRQGWTEGTGELTIIIDPWGSEYRYRSGEAARNPDFDLWSAGKDGETNPDNPTNPENNDDIRN